MTEGVDPEVDAFLRGGAGRGPTADRVEETPIAVIFLTGGLAYKVKKPVDFGFVDYASLAKRRWAIQREFEFNRRHAADLYRAVHPIIRTPQGALRFGDTGEPAPESVLEWVLEMRRFDAEALLANRPQLVVGDFAEALGRQVARMQADAPARPQGGGAGALDYTLRSNAHQLRTLAPALGEDAVEALIGETEVAFARAAPLLEARRVQGFARRCHGDLHLGNIIVEEGVATPFDCIEFNDRLSDVDVLYDLAFLLMDLLFRGQAHGANRALSGWLDQAARADGDAVWSGLAALPLFMAIRAAVRAHVTGRRDPESGRRYVAAARAHLCPRVAALHAIGGMSGAGKTTRARALAPGRGAPPGAVVLRTDEIRKRLWACAPTERLPAQAYDEAADTQVYAALFEAARRAFAADVPVILDAAFLDPQRRAEAEDLARRCDVDFTAEWLEIDPEEATARLSARRGDASDADVRVLESQLARGTGALSPAWRTILSQAPANAPSTTFGGPRPPRCG